MYKKDFFSSQKEISVVFKFNVKVARKCTFSVKCIYEGKTKKSDESVLSPEWLHASSAQKDHP